MADRNIVKKLMRLITASALAITLVSNTVNASPCRLSVSLICWTTPDRVMALIRVFVASNGNTEQLTAMGMSDVFQGNAIFLREDSKIDVIPLNEIVSEVRVNGVTLYTLTQAIQCR